MPSARMQHQRRQAIVGLACFLLALSAIVLHAAEEPGSTGETAGTDGATKPRASAPVPAIGAPLEVPPAEEDKETETLGVPEAVPQERPDESLPEIVAFREGLKELRSITGKIRDLTAQQGLGDADERAAELVRLSDELDVALAHTVATTEEVLKKFPGFVEGDRFIAAAANRLIAQDQIEEGQRLGKLLEQRFGQSGDLLNFLGRSAYELANLETAEGYFRRANDRGELSVENRRLLLGIAELRPLVMAEMKRRAADEASENLPRIVFHTTRGDFTVELYEDDQPNLTANLITLVEQKFYDGLTFFRVANAFGATCGCPTGDGSGGPGYNLEADRPNPPRLAMRGTLSMLTEGNATHGSQFFISFRQSSLSPGDRKMPVVGRIVAGLDVACRLRRIDRSVGIRAEPDKILQATIERKREHPYHAVTSANVALAMIEEGRSLARDKKLDEAILKLSEVVEKFPENFDGHYSLAMSAGEAKRFDLAAVHFEKAIAMRPSFPGIAFRLGVVYASLGQWKKGEELFRRALEVDPRDPTAWNNLATCLMSLKEPAEARKALEKALEINPNYQQAKNNLTRLNTTTAP